MNKIKIIQFDKYHKDENFLENLGRETMNQGDNPLSEKFLEPKGFRINPFSSEDLGIKDFRNTNLIGFKKSDGDKNVSPILSGEEFVFEDQLFLLNGNKREIEIFNGRSNQFPGEAKRRHVLGKGISRPESIKCFYFDRLKNKYILIDKVDEFSKVKSTQEVDNGASGKFFNWPIIDYSTPEFIIDKRFSERKELCLNQDETSFLHFVGPDFTSINIDDYTSVMEIAIRDDEETSVFWSRFSPLNNFSLYERITATSIREWTRIDFETATLGTGDLFYNLEEKIGRITVNTAFSTFVGDLYCSYQPKLGVSYLAEGKNSYHAKEIEMGRINDGNVGSYYLSFEEKAPESISLSAEIEECSLSGDVFESLFYGDPPSLVSMKIQNNNTKEPLVGEEVKISIKNNLGRMIGEDLNKTLNLYSDVNGEIKFFLESPRLGRESGATGFEEETSYSLLLATESGMTLTHFTVLNYGENHHFDFSKDHLYTYVTLKDDPFVGRQGTQITDEDIIWSNSILNGRNVIVNEYSPANQEWRPVQPYAQTETQLMFQANLPEVNATDTSIKYGNFVVMGPRYIVLEVELPKRKKYIDPRQYKVLVKFRNQAQGNHVSSGNLYPLGWKLLSNAQNLANQFGGALYMTLNPVFGNETIVFEVSEYENSHPILDLYFEVEV